MTWVDPLCPCMPLYKHLTFIFLLLHLLTNKILYSSLTLARLRRGLLACSVQRLDSRTICESLHAQYWFTAIARTIALPVTCETTKTMPEFNYYNPALQQHPSLSSTLQTLPKLHSYLQVWLGVLPWGQFQPVVWYTHNYLVYFFCFFALHAVI